MSEIKLQPSSQEAEDAILGAIIHTPSILAKVEEYISSDILYYNRSKRLFSIIKEMVKNDQKIDTITIVGSLSESDQSNGLDAYYISGLLDKFGSIENCVSYAKQIYEKFLLRELIQQSDQISESAYKNNSDVYGILGDAHSTIGRLIDIKPGITFNIKESMKETMESIVESDKNIIKTGFDGIDKLSGGMTRGEITILGGRPGHGKTTSMLNMVKSCVDQGLKVIVFNREMTNIEMLKKLIVL